MANVDVIIKAKQDLEAIGQQWNTPCDAYRITNLAAQRAGWKLIQKTSGDNCQGRKVDGLIVEGMAIDCLKSAGPPVNANEPTWQVLGPQNALIALDPMHDPIDDNPNPPDPDNGNGDNDLDMKYIHDQFMLVHQKLDHLVGQNEQILNGLVQSNSQLNDRLTQIVNDLEESLKKLIPILSTLCKFNPAVGQNKTDAEVYRNK